MIQEKKYFDGFLNADDEDFVVGKNEYINAENLRFGTTDAGRVGGLESIKGTTAVTQGYPTTEDGGSTPVTFAFPRGVNICVGVAVEESRNRFCWFNYNYDSIDNVNRSGVYCYDRTTGLIYTLMYNRLSGGVNFIDKDYIIDARIIDGLLYWTNERIEPRRINIDKAIKTHHATYVTTETAFTPDNGTTQIILPDQTMLIRRPPGAPLIVAGNTVSGLAYNNLKNDAVQFAYRYVYHDGEESVLSPISDLFCQAGLTTYNSVLLSFSLNEIFESDIKRVDVCVRYNNSGNFFIIKTYDRDIATDNTALNDHSSNTTQLTFIFKNDLVGIPLDNAYSVKQFENIPLSSKTLELVDGRLFLANNKTGYDSPTRTSLATTFTTTTLPPNRRVEFKNGSAYRVGVQFRDKYRRPIGGVITNDANKILTADRTYAGTPHIYRADWTLSNADPTEIPIEAYYYEVVVTKNLVTRFFVQDKGVQWKYVYKDTATGEYVFQNSEVAPAGVQFYGTAIDIALLPLRNRGYGYQPGDICKLYFSSGTTYTLPVLGQEGDLVILQYVNLGRGGTGLWGSTTPDKFIFEIYTPYTESREEVFYSQGYSNVRLITNPGTNTRGYVAGGSGATATGFLVGDIYAFPKTYNSVSYILNEMQNDDIDWRRWIGNWGNPSIVQKTKQQQKTTAIRYSNVKLSGTENNGLSTFDVLDEKLLTFEIGSIQKLIRTSKVQGEKGQVMLAIGENETASMYLGEVQLLSSNTDAFLAQTTGVIGTVNILKGSYGTINPESVCEHRGMVFWFDAKSGQFVQYSVNGLDPISNNKLKRFAKLFSDKFLSLSRNAMETFGYRPFIFGIVDPYHNEVLWSLPQVETSYPKGTLTEYTSPINYPYDSYDGRAKTLVYKFEGDRYLGFFTMTPEFFVSLGENIFCFRSGSLYKNNAGSYNNFFGVDYKSKLMFVANDQPGKIRTIENIAIEANKKPEFTHIRTEYPNIQGTDLEAGDYITKEGVHYATLYRDRLSPNATGTYEQKLYKGDKIRGATAKIMLQFSEADGLQTQIKMIDVGYVISVGHTV